MMIHSARTEVIGIAILTGIAVMGDAMLFIVLPIYWVDFGLTAIWQIGVLLSINRFIRLPINPLVGYFYQRFSLQTGIWIAFILTILSTFSYGFVHNFWILLLMRIFWGIAWSLIRLGGFLTVITITKEDSRGQYVGLYNGIWGIGSLLGMLGGGILITFTSVSMLSTVFSFIACMALPAIPALIPVMKEKEIKQKETSPDLIPSSWKTTRVLMVLLTSFTMGFVIFGLFSSTLSSIIEQNYVQTWSTFSVTISAAMIAGSIQAIRWAWDPWLAPLIGKQLDKNKSQNLILYAALFGTGIVFFIIGQVTHFLTLCALLLAFQLISSTFVTTSDTLAAKVASKTNRIKVMTAHTVMIDVGAALGPLISFVLLEYFTLTMVYTVAAILVIWLAGGWMMFHTKKLASYPVNHKF